MIDPPERKDDYIDRKGDVSIILQGICNEKKEFIDIFVGYPGSVHDSRVFKNSPAFEKLKSQGNYTYKKSFKININIYLYFRQYFVGRLGVSIE